MDGAVSMQDILSKKEGVEALIQDISKLKVINEATLKEFDSIFNLFSSQLPEPVIAVRTRKT